MTGPRDIMLAVSIVVLVAIGMVLEVASSEVATPAPTRVGGPRFVERALFCAAGTTDIRSFAVASTAGADAASLGIEPERPERVPLQSDRIFVQELANDSPTDVVGYGAPVRAGVVMRAHDPVVGEAASKCSDRSSPRWFFAAGASTLGVDERLVIYNPFPEEAVARVTFLTTVGEDRKGNLADVQVPSKSVAIIKVNEFIRLERTLGVRIDTRRGRVVAWRVLFDRPEDAPTGVHLSLGTATTSDTWFFPEGWALPGITERIFLMNPNREEATVTISVVAGETTVQPPELVEIAVPPGTTQSVTLGSVLKGRQAELGGISVVVQSTNGVGIVAERWIRYDTSSLSGSSAEIGAPSPALRWLLPTATLNPATDAIIVMNPGSTAARVSMELLYEDRGSASPADLQDREVAPGARLRIGIGSWTQGRTVAVRVASTAPVVAERASYSDVLQDVAAVMGFRLE